MARCGWLPPGPGGIRLIGEIHLLRSTHRARAAHRGRLQCNFASAGFGLGTGTAVDVGTATDLLTTSPSNFDGIPYSILLDLDFCVATDASVRPAQFPDS